MRPGEMSYDQGWTQGYRDGLEGKRDEPIGDWDCPVVQGYAHGWSAGNCRRIEKELLNRQNA